MTVSQNSPLAGKAELPASTRRLGFKPDPVATVTSQLIPAAERVSVMTALVSLEHRALEPTRLVNASPAARRLLRAGALATIPQPNVAPSLGRAGAGA